MQPHFWRHHDHNENKLDDWAKRIYKTDVESFQQVLVDFLPLVKIYSTFLHLLSYIHLFIYYIPDRFFL